MKKVLIIYKFLPQYRVEFFNLLREVLKKDGIELNLIYGKNKNLDSLKKDEVEIEWGYYIPNKIIRIGGTELIWQPCLKHLKEQDIVVVEQANKLLLNYYLMFFRHFQKYKFALWGHGRDMQDDFTSMRNKFKYLLIDKCDWWFAYTKGVKKMLIDMDVDEKKITVVQNAIDTSTLKKAYNEIPDSALNEIKSTLGITGPNTGIYCGAMYPGKRIDFILEACFKIKASIPDFHFIFLGAGIDSHLIQKAAEKNDWIHYVGPKFGVHRVKYFKISSIQLMPYLVGLGILDSFALETPIITTEHPSHGPEIEYLESNVNGIITKNSLEIYANTAIDVLKNKQYIRLINGCKEASQNYTVEKMVENFKTGVLSCLNS
jgi:glycosyltransferase involved in cell wall biosynthesis